MPLETETVVSDLPGDDNDAAALSSGSANGIFRIDTKEVVVPQKPSLTAPGDSQPRTGNQDIHSDVTGVSKDNLQLNGFGDTATRSAVSPVSQDPQTATEDYAAPLASHVKLDPDDSIVDTAAAWIVGVFLIFIALGILGVLVAAQFKR